MENNFKQFVLKQTEEIRFKVSDKKVILGLSGGVDSSVVAKLLHDILKDQLICIFVDHGLLRQNEVLEVQKTFKETFKMNLITFDAKKHFLDKLKGITDPEEKRKIIGHEFIAIFEREAKKIKDVAFLAQGTILADVIESGKKGSANIKSHHNVGGLPEKLGLELIEPLKTLYKDEVRALGSYLGLSDEIIKRQPFPGPGLAIRVIGEITDEKLAIVRKSDYILREEIKNHQLDQLIWQYFTVVLPVKTVGVKNQKRTYDHVVAIRAINSIDGMSAHIYELPYVLLKKLSERLIYEVDGIGRVVYDITSKPPGTIEWE